MEFCPEPASGIRNIVFHYKVININESVGISTGVGSLYFRLPVKKPC